MHLNLDCEFLISYNNVFLMNINLKRNVCLEALCFLLLISTITSFNFKELRVTAASYTTNVVTSYTIFFDRTITNSFTSTAYLTTPLNVNSTITVTFPTQYTLTNNVTCTYQLNSTGSFAPTPCTQLNNQITLSNIFSGSTVLASATVVVANVLNPFPAGKTSNFVGTIGSDIAVANNVNSLVTISPAASVCGFTFSPNTVYSTGSMIITLTVTNQFPSTGTIGVQFPLTKLWVNELDSTRALPISTGMTCGSQSANVNAGIQCTGSASFATVTLSSVVTSGLSSGATISFSIANFYSPPSNQPADNVVVTTYTGTASIDTCSAVVSGLIPKTIPSSQFTISEVDDLPMVVNQMYTLKFGLTTLDIISLSDYFVITFPAGTSINNFATATLGGTIGFNSFSSTYYNQVLTLYMQGSGTLAAGQIYITISNFVAPPSILTTDNFVLQILSNNYPKMVSYQSLQASTGAITGSVLLSISTVNIVTSYTFSIKISNSLTSAGRLKIIIPSIIGVSINSTCGVLTGNFMSTIPLCTYNSLQNSIIFSNLNNSNSNIPAQTFTLLVNGLKNPPSNAITAPFSLISYYTGSDSTAVDAGNINGVTAIAGIIDYTTIVVSSSSFVTSDTGVTYYFSFVLNNPVPRGGFLIVYFPTIIYFNLAIANNNCEISINASAAATTPCTANLGTTYVFNFTNPFPSSGVGINTNITLNILSAATNPPTTAPISPFSLQAYYSDGSSIASVYNSSSYNKIVTPSAFISNQISKISNKNGEYTNFTVSLIQTAALQANAIIRVTLPSTLLAQLSSACIITYQGTPQGAACGLTGSTFKIISLNTQIPAGISFSITFTNIRNALSFSTISPFVTTTKTATDLYFYSSSSSNNNIENTIPSAFKSLTYQYSPQELNTAVTLQVTFQFSQFSLVPGFLQISIDTYFGIVGLSCSSFIDFTATCTSISSNTLKVSGSFNNSVMGFTVTGFTSPTFVPPSTTYTVLNSFDSSGYKIDESATTISFAIGCNLPCKTCNANKSFCLSCYQTTNITTSIYYHGSTNYCYTTCPSTTYNNAALLQCSSCNSNCLHCLNSATFCTRCFPNSTYPYLQISNSSQICVSGCQSGYFPNPSLDPITCTVCIPPCATCSAENICLSCISGYFYLGNMTCTTVCTPGVTVANNATNVCDPCDSICLTCVGSISSCTACNSPLVFYNGSCQNSCPIGGKLAPSNGICTACDPTCLTCMNSTTFCTSCNTSSIYIYLVNNKCLVNCPNYYYKQTSTGMCYSCLLANINCLNCSSAITCYACDNGYVFFNNQCLTYTPTGYVNISGIAVICAGDCKTCEFTTTNCTSCKTLNYEPYTCVSNCSVGKIAQMNVCVTCTPPCLTCTGSQVTCTSCITNLSPPEYLFGTTCQKNCPDFYYANNSNSQCTPCINNCLLCTSSVICVSCITNTYLFNVSCLSICPSGLTGIGGLCQPCTDNCKTCSLGTNICLSCVPNTYFLNTTQTCSSNCGTGLFIDYVNQTCVGCSSECKTCLNTSSSCTSCPGTNVLLNFKCLSECPTNMFVQAGFCQTCPENCTTCTSLSNCLGCYGVNYLYNGDCIGSCPSTSGYIRNGICSQCTTQHCYQCTSTNVCISCSSGYLYLTAMCLDACPSSYKSNGTHCIDALSASLEVANKTFPVPFTIAGVVLIIACLMSRLQFQETYLSGAIYSLIAILQWCALWYFLYLYFISSYMDEPIALYIGLGALAYLYIMNLVSVIAQSAFLCYEKQFCTWLAYSKFNKCFYYFTNSISVITNHKFRNILFCKLFTFKIFSAKLDKVEDFKIFNIFSLISIVHSGAAIFAAGVALTKTNNKEQLYHECLDVAILTGLNAVMAFFNTHKDKNFFEQITPEGYALHKKNSVIEEHLVGSKFNGLGEDAEIQQGYMNNYNHALTSKQALKFQTDSMASVGLIGEGYSDSSMSELNEKMYEQASCQALDLINDKANITAKTNAVMPKPTYEDISIQAESLIQEQQRAKGVDFSSLQGKTFDADSSNFTNYNLFKKVDQSVQGYLDRRVNVSAQIQAEQVDESIQNDNHLGDYVDFSVQKNSNYERNDISVQKTSKHPVDMSMQYSSKQKDASLQYSRNMQDESVSMSRRQRSFGVQQNRTLSNKSIAANVSMRNQSNQLSIISQQDEQVQMQPQMIEQGIQPTIQFQDQAIQHQIQYEDYSVQPDIEYNEIAVQPTLDPSINEIAIQYQPVNEVNYNEFEEELGDSNTGTNILFQNESGGEESCDRQLAEEKVEELELKNENIRSYQEQLQERIRNKEKELNEIKRKIDYKERMNQKKKVELEDKQNRIEERDIEIQGYQYNENRPFVKPPQKAQSERVKSQKIQEDKQSLNREHLIEQIQYRRQPQTKIENKSNLMNAQVSREQSKKLVPYQLEIQSKQIPKVQQNNSYEQSLRKGDKVLESKQSESVAYNDKTIEEIKVVKEDIVPRQQEKRSNVVQQIIRFEEVKPVKKNVDISETKSDFGRKHRAQKRPVQYMRQDIDLQSEQQASQAKYITHQNTAKNLLNQRQKSIPSSQVNPIQRSPKEIIRMREPQTTTRPQPPANFQSNIYQREQPIQMQESSQIPHHIEIKDMGNEQLDENSVANQQIIQFEEQIQYEAKSNGNRESEITRKNYYKQPANQRREVVVDVTEIDQSLNGGEDFIELEEASQSDQEPSGINNAYYHAKPNIRNHSRSDLSGTIEQIPRHYENADNDKTISMNDHSNTRHQLSRPTVNQQKIANYFAGNLANPAQGRGKNHEIPIQPDVKDHYRINKLYSNNDLKQKAEDIPKNIHQREKKNTFAIAGRAQLAEDKLMQKKGDAKYPLKTNKPEWEARQEDKYVSEDEEFQPNRTNLVRKPIASFASHLVLPQETDKQPTSFQGKGKVQQKPPTTAKDRSKNTQSRPQPEQIQVHFEADHYSRQLSINQKNRSPQYPRAYNKRTTSNLQSQLYDEDEEEVDYRNAMVLNQMQSRPQNGDLEDYYKRKNTSKDNRRKSNSKVDKSTQKIYLQRLDKNRK